MRFAMKHPEKVEALILNGGNLNARGVKASVQIPIELGYRMTKLFSRISEKARKNHEMLALMVDDPNIELSELKEIHVPTLVIAGTEDMIKEEHTKLLAAEIPGAELKFVKGGHFVAAKASEEFNAAVDLFLERVL